MTRVPMPRARSRLAWRDVGAVAVGALLVGAFGLMAHAQVAAPTPAAASNTKPAAGAPVEQGVTWRSLTPAQRSALQPLEADWPGIDAARKQKWLQVAVRFPAMSPSEQARIQERMNAWAKLTPPQRGQARLRYQEARQLPPADRQARWDAYQALPPEQRKALAEKSAASSAALPAALSASGVAPGDSPMRGRERSARDPSTAGGKTNVVAGPGTDSALRPVAPTVVQVRPGATTTPVTRAPAPPAHQQSGLPKIAATPGFVDRATLLPQRGPQGAAARRPASAPAPVSNSALPAPPAR